MEFSPVLGYFKTTKKEKQIIQEQNDTIKSLQNEINTLKKKISMIDSKQSCNKTYDSLSNIEKQNKINKTTIDLLKDLILKQSVEIRKLRKNNITHLDF